MEQKTKRFILSFFVILVILSPFYGILFLQYVNATNQPASVAISDSMKPYIKKGDVIISEGIDDVNHIRAEADNGDVVIFDSEGLWKNSSNIPIAHRAIEKFYNDSKWYLITKGDANDVPDECPIPEDRIIGVVVEVIPYIGWGKLILMRISLYVQLIMFSVLMIILIRELRKLKL